MTDPKTPETDELADAAEAGDAATDAAGAAEGTDTVGETATEAANAAAGAADPLAADPLAAALREAETQKDKYLRLYAEFENFRRRAARDRQEAEHRGMGNLLRGTLEMLDDLARVAHVDPASTDASTVVEGVAMVEKKLLKSFAGHGLEVVSPEGEPFDPALHEAISTVPAEHADEDHLVAQVYQVGYVFNGTLLRPARVVVKQWNG
ncbi:MAG: nucleotide exchange factor GrpE [Gemmatimonadaceae bacterium]